MSLLPRHAVWLVFALVACHGGDGEDSAKEDGSDTDTDVATDTDTDTDTPTGTDTDATRPPPMECLDAPCDADPVGTWSILGECLDDPQLHDLETRCPALQIGYYAGGPDGTVQFSGTDYLFDDPGGNTVIYFEVPEDCNTGGCLTWQVPDLGVACTTNGEGGCECNGNLGSQPWLDSGTWTRAGGQLSLQSEASGGDKSLEVCVDGDTIWMRDTVRGIAVSGVRAP